MTSLEVYKRILLKVNLNDTNGNITIPKATAVLIFNQEVPKWLSDRIDKGLNSDEIDDLEELLVPDTELDKIEDLRDSTDFKLPTNFFEYSRSYSIAKKGQCSDRVLYNWNLKNKNLNAILLNENEKPSFEYEETLIKIVNGKLKVYKTDFQIERQFLDYYKLPRAIEIEGYRKFDGSASQNVNPDFSDFLVDEVISRVALEIMRNQTVQEGFALTKDKVASDK